MYEYIWQKLNTSFKKLNTIKYTLLCNTDSVVIVRQRKKKCFYSILYKVHEAKQEYLHCCIKPQRNFALKIYGNVAVGNFY